MGCLFPGEHNPNHADDRLFPVLINNTEFIGTEKEMHWQIDDPYTVLVSFGSRMYYWEEFDEPEGSGWFDLDGVRI